RMGNVPMPKQFLLLNEKPVIVHTLEKFLLNPRFEKIIVASPKEWINYTQDILKKYILDMSKIIIVDGGKERNDTIMNIIKDTESRSNMIETNIMYPEQTPKTFNIKKLYDLYNSISTEEKDILTDACKIFSMKDKHVKLVIGEIFNIKITTPYDLNVANSIIK